jgi:hypothetical protein
VLTRRDLLQLAGLGAAAAGCKRTTQAAPAQVTRSDDGALDEVLEMLHAAEPQAKQGLSTHAPMVAEALCALGHPERAKAWVERYDAPTLQLPPPTQPIDRNAWRAALGPRRDAPTWERQLVRWADWKQLFLEDLQRGPWQPVLEVWVARLAPGISSAATHGVIRTAHAARALGRRDTPPRRAEHARGLAYWAAAYEELPASGSRAKATTLDAAVAALPRYRVAHGDAPDGNIVSGLRAVAAFPAFAPVRDSVALPEEPATALGALSTTFSRVLVEHAPRGHAVAFVHAITGPCALRRLAPHVSAATARAALPYAWQAAAAIYTAYAATTPAPPPRGTPPTPDALVERALDHGGDHAIKLVEVLLAEHALHADPLYLTAASTALRVL